MSKKVTTAAGLALAGAFAVGGALPALAGGLAAPQVEAPVAAPAPAPVLQKGADWTGGWAALDLGYGHARAGSGNSGHGAVYGLSGGYDYDFGSWVAGVGLDWDKSNAGLNGNDKLRDITRLKFRAGADMGSTLVYLTAGPARAKADVAGVSGSDNGWFGGVGATYALNDRWTVGGELLANRFNNFKNTGTDVKATTATVNVGLRF